MPLSINDIKRLKRLGYNVNEFVVTVDGERRLRNIDGHCFFLLYGKCKVYEDRPTGCKIYPLVVDYSGNTLIDPDCRYSDKFVIEKGDAARLKSFLKRLSREKHKKLF